MVSTRKRKALATVMHSSPMTEAMTFARMEESVVFTSMQLVELVEMLKHRKQCLKSIKNISQIYE